MVISCRFGPSSLCNSAPGEGGDPPSNSPALSEERRSSQNSVRISLGPAPSTCQDIPELCNLQHIFRVLRFSVFLCLLFMLVFRRVSALPGEAWGAHPPRYLVISSIFVALENVFPAVGLDFRRD